MEYRGVQYEVVQTINKTWRWSVKHENGYKVGIALDSKEAVRRAEQFIDDLIRLEGKPKR
jgi:hypothetical protein